MHTLKETFFSILMAIFIVLVFVGFINFIHVRILHQSYCLGGISINDELIVHINSEGEEVKSLFLQKCD